MDNEIISLAELAPGTPARVAEIKGEDNARRMKLAALGVVPGSVVRVQQSRPAYVIWVDETLLSLERRVAESIWLVAP